mmetsp:Transcript_1700/g.3330  ORF Transcript_1700/g.3330 Transcript_1700/m.3330 type:complete len:490 (-) Transcript_1700:140-1609(-)
MIPCWPPPLQHGGPPAYNSMLYTMGQNYPNSIMHNTTSEHATYNNWTLSGTTPTFCIPTLHSQPYLVWSGMGCVYGGAWGTPMPPLTPSIPWQPEGRILPLNMGDNTSDVGTSCTSNVVISDVHGNASAKDATDLSQEGAESDGLPKELPAQQDICVDKAAATQPLPKRTFRTKKIQPRAPTPPPLSTEDKIVERDTSRLLPSAKLKPQGKRKQWCAFHGWCTHITEGCTAPEDKEPEGKAREAEFDTRTKKYLAKKEVEKLPHKCDTCWHPRNRCICGIIKPLAITTSVSFVLYLHYSEYLCGGDDAKLMQLVAPERTRLLVYGRGNDDDILLEEVAKNPTGTFLLYPSSTAITVDDFKAALNPEGQPLGSRHLTLIVLDATWGRTRNMLHHFNTKLKLNIPHIQLQPTTLSVYSRTQSQPDRICTVEAIALLLQEFGEPQEVCDALVDCVRINNQAMATYTKVDDVVQKCKAIQSGIDASLCAKGST